MQLQSLCCFLGMFLLQSILRQANFKGAKLLGASFFDADLTGSDAVLVNLLDVPFITVVVVILPQCEVLKWQN
jgi:uncharacterized protein YjbI with pentapeptide repeats